MLVDRDKRWFVSLGAVAADSPGSQAGSVATQASLLAWHLLLAFESKRILCAL